ncbi:RHS repeat domain-containing protein [Pseudomonas alkylphenolica]|uniref:Insecticidal toxin complex protein TccC1 n=1 Tax=Pseudomonas alkylphenolica TaxID=237609 RepID=A0A077FFC2_9PSED|nr:RHS repeat-associated core domain-containing protein [Pseudomonas alkylphenolica]AIL61896.1 insecticidal toxin complex protein TccC1 [Pseudomonas alkylphenolica]
MLTYLYQHTPSLTVIDPRGLPARTIAYHRRDVEEDIAAHVHRQVFNAMGHLSQQWDPRLLELSEIAVGVQPNQTTLHSLSGQVLQSESVDAGWRVTCYDAAGLLCDSWDGREIHRRYHYDERMRPVSVFEHALEQCVERFTYAGSDEEDARNNRSGRLIRHDDQAGSLWYEHYGLLTQPLTETRRFCKSLTPPNWPASEADLQDKTYTTHWRHDALGAVVERTDALGHVQRFEVNIAGQPFACRLDGVALLKSTTYNAFGQVEIERAGNDVLSTACYSPVDGRLCRLNAEKAGGKMLQDLNYQYDPVGNIERIEDLAQPVQWFAQQRIQALSTYTYDSLYQLTNATGRESASQIIGPGLPWLEIFGAVDDSRWRNYSQTYTYDSGGNLTRLKHEAGAGNVYAREMVVDECSNRSIFKDDSPIEFDKAFDANGNGQALTPGQLMKWDSRNQLCQVTQVQRDEPDGQDDDVETYVYDGSGQRVRKVRRAKTRGGEQVSEVLYLPGLEIRTRTSGETMHTVVAQAGRNDVRLLHWEDGLRKGIDNDQLRYSLSDHLGSSALELDQNAELVCQESYYPYGGTAWWAAKSASEAKYKTVRYSGKERDATGLYYYGFRYYAPWLQRWINPDPAGDIDGLNLYRMVRNNPVSLQDENGFSPDVDILEKFESPGAFYERTGREFLYRAIRTMESEKLHPETGDKGKLPPDGDAFPELKDKHLERAAKYRSMKTWEGGDIVSTGPELKRLPLQHVSGDNQQSQYISTGTRGAAAYNTVYNWNSKGVGKERRKRPEKDWDPIIKIDVKKLDSGTKIYDMQQEGLKDRDRSDIGQLAEADAEVLISNKINASAIVSVFTNSADYNKFLEEYFPPAKSDGAAASPLVNKIKRSERGGSRRTVSESVADAPVEVFKKRAPIKPQSFRKRRLSS